MKNKFNYLGKSIRGSSHIKNGIPNQDSIKYNFLEDINAYILSVADGHGSSKYFRSDKGSKLATCVANGVVKKILNNNKDLIDYPYSQLKDLFEEKIPKEIIQQWKNSVKSHFSANPFLDEELEKLKLKESEKAISEINNNPIIPYGSTLLVLVITETLIVSMQIGDGDMLFVYNNNVHSVFKKDDSFLGNVTPSLSSNNPLKDFNVSIEKNISGEGPSLYMLTTDGYPNSFVNQENFFKVAVDFLNIIKTEGVSEVEKNIESWLTEASAKGSGDDITIGLLYREVVNNEYS